MTKIFINELQELRDRGPDLSTAWDYYEGGVPEYFSTPQLRRAVRASVSKIGLNHSRTVITSLVNRLEINNVVGASEKSNRIINKTLETNGKGFFFNDLFTKASVFGEAFAMAWPDSNGEWRLSAYTPKNTFIVYSKENPWEKECAVRIWQEEGRVRLNAFYADRIVRWAANGEGFESATDWDLLGTEDNPFGVIPFVHLRNDAEHGRPEHKDAFSAQDAINKLVITQLDTVDYLGAPQRYAMANATGEDGALEDYDEDESDRANSEAMKSGPGELWYLKGVSKVGEFKAADPDQFWKPVKDFVRTMASLTETPIHYFEQGGQVFSGPGLRAAEAPLLKKAQRRREVFTKALSELFAFILKAENSKTEVTIKWESADSIDILEKWDLLAKQRNVGMPFRQVLIEAGYAQGEIDQIIAWADEEAEKAGSYESYKRATPTVRVQEQNDETKIDTGEIE